MADRRIQWAADVVDRIPNGQYNQNLRDKRVGVMLHYDASRVDEAALRWFGDPRCKVSYHFLVLDDGSYGSIAPFHTRAWHAGVCRPSDPEKLPYTDANSAFVGVAAATNDVVGVTAPQMLTMAWLARMCFAVHGWNPSETWRVVGHDTEAWPRGRKCDPIGGAPKNPILATEDIRRLVPLIEPSFGGLEQ